MKKSFIIILLLQFSTLATLKAQETVVVAPVVPSFHRVEFGIRFMPTVSKFKMETSDGNTIKGEGTFGFGIGGILGVNITNHIGIQGELIYNTLSQKYKNEELDQKIRVNYLNIPLMLSLNTGKSKPVNLNVVFGPQLGINMGSKISKSGDANTDTITYVIATKRNDIGLAYGAGLEFMLNEIRTIRLDMGFRGVYGLTNIRRNDTSAGNETNPIPENTKVRTSAAYFGLSFLF